MSKETFFKSELLSHLNYSVWLQSVEDKILPYDKKCRKLLKHFGQAVKKPYERAKAYGEIANQ